MPIGMQCADHCRFSAPISNENVNAETHLKRTVLKEGAFQFSQGKEEPDTTNPDVIDLCLKTLQKYWFEELLNRQQVNFAPRQIDNENENVFCLFLPISNEASFRKLCLVHVWCFIYSFKSISESNITGEIIVCLNSYILVQCNARKCYLFCNSSVNIRSSSTLQEQWGIYQMTYHLSISQNAMFVTLF